MTARAAVALALALIAGPGCRSPAPSQLDHAEMARDQLFFVSQTPEPVLLALIVQRTREPRRPGAMLEVKAFLVARDRLQSLFWERVALDAWPGDDLQDALAAWQQQRRGPGLRLSFSIAPAAVDVAVRQPGGGFELRADALTAMGEVADPHGQASLRAGVGSLEVNGELWRGPVLAEHLAPGSHAWPHFGQFEMWLVAPQDGALWLGRQDLRQGSAQAVVVAPGKPPRIQGFSAQATQTRLDATTGFALPTAWQVALDRPVRFARRSGQTGRGEAPGGGPAVYDISVAAMETATALVFHLHDQ